MPHLFRWQWLWRSRVRLLTFGLSVFALWLALAGLLIGLVVWGRPNANIARGIPAPVMLLALGGYVILQAVFSPSGAFGDHDNADERAARRSLDRRLRKYTRRANENAIPLEDELKSQAYVPCETRCPMCEDRVTVPAGHPPNGTVQCPKCLEGFVPT